MKTVLVSGSAGYIGSNAVPRFGQACLAGERVMLRASLKARSP